MSWRRHWQAVIPFFAFPDEVRRIIYTTNAIEALNSKLRRAVRTRGHLMIQRAAESTTALTWRQLHDQLTPIKAVRYTAEGRTIVQAGKIGPESRAPLKKLYIATPKAILDVA